MNEIETENLKVPKRKLEKLSKDFSGHCGRDEAKKCILFSKYILQALNVWPDNYSAIRRWVVIFVIVNLGLMEIAHVAFGVIHITEISKIAPASTTISTTFETMAKLATMLYFRDTLNEILCIIWHDFWPLNITSKTNQIHIKYRACYVLSVASLFLLMAYISLAQFLIYPLVENRQQLPLASWFPFDFMASPVYEMIYLWQWFLNEIVITTLSGFDTFFNSIVMICAMQFQILQDVLESIFKEKGKMQWEILFGSTKIQQTEVLARCVEHHTKLIRVCRMVESTFKHIVFIQFVVSTLAICLSCVTVIADPTLMQQMLSYCAAHLLQFFIYCSVGNELTYQSGQVAEAAYDCDWEHSLDPNLMKGLVMIIQRAQRPEALTVAGLMQLSFANFMATVQLSFSFYTLLNNLM